LPCNWYETLILEEKRKPEPDIISQLEDLIGHSEDFCTHIIVRSRLESTRDVSTKQNRVEIVDGVDVVKWLKGEMKWKDFQDSYRYERNPEMAETVGAECSADLSAKGGIGFRRKSEKVQRKVDHFTLLDSESPKRNFFKFMYRAVGVEKIFNNLRMLRNITTYKHIDVSKVVMTETPAVIKTTIEKCLGIRLAVSGALLKTCKNERFKSERLVETLALTEELMVLLALVMQEVKMEGVLKTSLAIVSVIRYLKKRIATVSDARNLFVAIEKVKEKVRHLHSSSCPNRTILDSLLDSNFHGDQPIICECFGFCRDTSVGQVIDLFLRKWGIDAGMEIKLETLNRLAVQGLEYLGFSFTDVKKRKNLPIYKDVILENESKATSNRVCNKKRYKIDIGYNGTLQCL